MDSLWGTSPFGPAVAQLRRAQAKAGQVRQALFASPEHLYGPAARASASSGLDQAGRTPIPSETGPGGLGSPSAVPEPGARAPGEGNQGFEARTPGPAPPAHGPVFGAPAAGPDPTGVPAAGAGPNTRGSPFVFGPPRSEAPPAAVPNVVYQEFGSSSVTGALAAGIPRTEGLPDPGDPVPGPTPRQMFEALERMNARMEGLARKLEEGEAREREK